MLVIAACTVGLPIEALVMAEHIAWVGLSAALLKSYVRCSYLAEINRFLYDFAVGCRVADLLLLLMMIASLPPAIGPTFACQFLVVTGVRLSPSVGVSLSCAGPMAADRD